MGGLARDSGLYLVVEAMVEDGMVLVYTEDPRSVLIPHSPELKFSEHTGGRSAFGILPDV